MSGDVAAVAMSEDGGGGEGAGARADGKTTLKDVSKKDRLQRMDQRRMRLVTKTTPGRVLCSEGRRLHSLLSFFFFLFRRFMISVGSLALHACALP